MEREIHILVIPYPVQGHINPMLQFSKRLASKGPRVTVITTTSISRSMAAMQESSVVNFETISDGSDEGVNLASIDEELERFKLFVTQSLAELIESQNSSQHPPKFLVYDSVLPWALDVARQLGVDGAPFFTQSCAVNAIYYHAHKGAVGMPAEGPWVSLPSLPSLGLDDMPSFLCDTTSYQALLNLVVNQFSNFQKANWVFFNNFDKLEDEKEIEKHRKKMEGENHILVIPFPVQGHINPMLQFSKRLASKGARVTLVTLSSISNSMGALQASSVNFETISDGVEEGKKLESMEARAKDFLLVVSQSLAELIERQNVSKHPPKLLVYDSFMPWAVNVAKQFGLDGAAFFTQSCGVNAIYYHAHQGAIRMPLEGSPAPLPSMPPLGINDMPSFLCDTASYPAFLHLVLNQFSNFEEAKWLLYNTFESLEDEVVNWMASQWPVKTIGPAIPSMYLDKRLEDDKEYGLNLFKPNVDACMKWLDTKEIGSVVYASFGSLATLGEEQMEELALGLKNSNCYFLWVVRESEEKKLPVNFLQETAEKGLVVTWCPQLDVLAHKAIGCFMTHCGWNSTLEALSLGVPMVVMPQWTDQPTNAKFIVDVWKVGIRIQLDEKGIANKEEIALRIREVMEGERGKEIKNNSIRWKKLAIEAVDEGGSSDKNIEEFVAKLA